MDEVALHRQVERQLESLRHEFAEEEPASRITTFGEARFGELRADARILDYIPVLVYRQTRQELVRLRHEKTGGLARAGVEPNDATGESSHRVAAHAGPGLTLPPGR